MGLNSENAQANTTSYARAPMMCFDIETAPIDDAADYLEPVDAPVNYVKPEAIASYKARAQAEQLEKAALDVDLCRVVAIGVWLEASQRPFVWLETEYTEQVMLEEFWKIAQSTHLVGFHCTAFDLPVLQRRSLYLGVPMPAIAVDKYRHPQVTDLAQLLSYHGMLRLRSLSFYCKRFGIDVPDTLTGADIAQAVKDGRWADVAAHCEADVRKTAMLGAKLGCFRLTTDQPLLEGVC